MNVVGKTQHRLAAELITELEAIDRKIKACKKEITALVEAQGSTLLQLHGIGPSSAARLLADVGNIHRFASRDHFASWNGTAPLDASSGQRLRHRLSRAGNPADQPRAAHHGHRPAPEPGRRTCLLRRQESGGEDLHGGHALPQTAPSGEAVRVPGVRQRTI
jgi:hypothetical protein